MSRLTAVSVSGYRAISAEVELNGLGTVIALYGDNAVGKSSIVRAVEFLGRLCDHAVEELVGTGSAWPDDTFFDRFGEDAWMFNTLGGGRIEVSGTWSDGLRARFTLLREEGGVRIRGISVQDGDHDLAAAVRDAGATSRRLAEEAAASSPDVADYGTLHSDATEAASAFERDARRLADRLSAASRMRRVAPPTLPVADEVRASFLGALSSPLLPTRSAAKRALAVFGTLFPALGPGSMEPLENVAPHPRDLAWIGDGTTVALPLDQLGGGVQSVLGTLARLVLANASVVALEEPEAFVGNRAADGLAAAILAALQAGVCEQVWIATHDVDLAVPGVQLIILDSINGVVSARMGAPGDIARFAPDPQPPRPLSMGRLADDGSVRLPQALRERLGLRTGEFVHYVDIDESGARIVSAAEFDRLLSEASDK